MINFNNQVCSEMLKKEYSKAVSHRIGKDIPTYWLVKSKMNVFVDAVAAELSDYRLCKLFIEAQFNHFPVDWCNGCFKQPYPPARVVFCGQAWGRYRQYVEEGVRIPV